MSASWAALASHLPPDHSQWSDTVSQEDRPEYELQFTEHGTPSSTLCKSPLPWLKL
eukprot:TRINITY_DN4389_c0_g1_i1.p1 TRINITY_DN4389_c0_g1~~TRINITY_DN4389_c0_g1_i1.p1  ORF type:complete len:56 (+),score=5.03 TRINITY_DN4389_c0_g1_i1:152-319(+)